MLVYQRVPPKKIPKHRIYPDIWAVDGEQHQPPIGGGYPILETYVRTAKRPTKICRSPYCCSYPQLYPMKDVPEKMVDGNPHDINVNQYIPTISHHISYIISLISTISNPLYPIYIWTLPWLISPAYGTDLHSQAAPWHSSLPGAISWPYLPGPWPATATKCRPGWWD